VRADEKAGLLYDLAVSKPEGFTYRDVEDKYGWHRTNFVETVRVLRLMFAGDRITLTCESQGFRKPWLYKLVGTYDDARPWTSNRIGDLETRLETVHAVAETLTNATDGRTTEGRKVRKIERTINRLMEDLAEIAEGPTAA
jgi:hypothetical protein